MLLEISSTSRLIRVATYQAPPVVDSRWFCLSLAWRPFSANFSPSNSKNVSNFLGFPFTSLKMQIPPPQPPPQSPEPPHSVRVRVSEMEETPQILDEPSTSWEWNSLLDFNLDDQLNISWSPEYQTIDPSPNPSSEVVTEHSNRGSDGSDSRIRKRDPRLTCENFLAGIIPCACPEVDEKLEEEEGGSGKKRARTVSVAARCQVPGCEVDISELKGYHRRHRVCLRCANATSVVLDGQPKRYCQQCGKFHILPDFDEGKRSCRRKLERHNKRRRRKSTDPRGIAEKETQGDMPTEDLACDVEAGKDNLSLSSHRVDEPVVESEDGHASPLSSLPSSQDIRSDSVISFAASGEPQKEQAKDNSMFTLSSSFCDNKSAYSSVCPTGRISFKLYDWNPAEFPRRLRHQIFQWLASMPVELEGYIRPGCTILTVFIAMPRFMWEKVSEDAASYVHEFVSAPECMLFGRGTITVYLNDMIFRVMKGGTSLTNVKVEMQAPRLHYVHPTCFEAGKPMEFVACGSNLLQPKFRFLISFAGRYLPYNYRFAISHGKTASCHGNEVNSAQCCDHQIYKIYIPKTEPKLFGPAFIEVESEFGLSNFIPILFGDRQTCSEMQMVQEKLDGSLYSTRAHFGVLDAISGSCKFFESRQKAMSELILDIAWLLKQPKSEDDKLLSSSKIQRLNCLLSFLVQNDSIVLLGKILQSLENVMDAQKPFNPANKINDADMSLFQKYIVHAREIVHQRNQHTREIIQRPRSRFSEGDCFSQIHSENDRLYVVPSNNEDMEMAMEKRLGSITNSAFQERSETIPLLNGEVTTDVTHQQWPKKSCGRIFSSTILSPRPLVLIVAVAALCSGVCAVVFHPHKVGEFAVSIRRCLFGYSNS
ncbi:Transcription factor [Macleaya cordata]|uniref:Transcription factor n=1 Tax=Macleaya cordata TaxID=56857 RepID=A0A200QLU0_MACCD|nr:Transcription factor [Macleaya cordata]